MQCKYHSVLEIFMKWTWCWEQFHVLLLVNGYPYRRLTPFSPKSWGANEICIHKYKTNNHIMTFYKAILQKRPSKFVLFAHLQKCAKPVFVWKLVCANNTLHYYTAFYQRVSKDFTQINALTLSTSVCIFIHVLWVEKLKHRDIKASVFKLGSLKLPKETVTYIC